MAERRMFAKTIIDSDAFIDMPSTARLLYYDLAMRADDDGFINNPKKVAKMTNASDDDIKVLIGKNFIIPFENGVVVIKHWKIHNYIRGDRYKPTVYVEELALLTTKDNKGYTLGRPNDNQMETQVRLGKVSIGKDSIVVDKKSKYGEYKHVLLTEKELQSLKSSYDNYLELISYLDEYIEMKGYKAKSHYLCIKKWVIDAVKRNIKNTIKEPEKMSDFMRDILTKGNDEYEESGV